MIEKRVKIDSVKVLNQALGIVEAYVNTMGAPDLDNDLIDAAAFNDSIAHNLPIPVLVGHDTNQVVGKVTGARAMAWADGTSRLYTRLQYNMDTEAGRDAFSNVSGGYVREWSVGFNIPSGAASVVREAGRTLRKIATLDWIEVSSVLRGASPGTATIATKGATTPATDDAADAAADIVRTRIALAYQSVRGINV